MNRFRNSLIVLVAAVLLVVALPAAPAAQSTAFPVAEAQSRSVLWRRWDVTIDNVDTANNQYNVTEAYDLTFTGTFRFGSRVIDLVNLSRISRISVEQDGRALNADCSQGVGTYCVSQTNSKLTITYYFRRPITDGQASFNLFYTVEGAIRSYEGGDQLWWTAIPSEHFGFSINSSTIKVNLPPGFAPREGTDPVVTYGAPATVDVQGTSVTATANGRITGNQNFEIRVQYPHNPNLKPASWQSSFDSRRQYEDTVQPIINIVVILISLLLAIGGPLLIYTRYMAAGRDPNVGPVPQFLTELPSNLSPAVVGTLLDERADVRDVMSILLDLAHRGYIVIEEGRTEGLFGIGKSSEFTFKRTDKSDADLKPYESRFMRNVFTGGTLERSLSSLRNKFYSVIPQIQDDLYDALVAEGLFPSKPSSVRARWSGLGFLLIVASVAIFFLGAAMIESVGGAAMCIPFAVGLTGIFALIAGQYMPAKTRKGAEEAAKWTAFLEYLRNLEKYQDVGVAAEHFDDFLPYAVAFGLDRTWMQRFKSVPDVPVPYWYYPTYVGGLYRRGYIPGTPLAGGAFGGSGGLPGDLARAGGGGLSLDNMSGNLAGGLENLSTGLTSMLDSASRAMTSRPQSASSGSSGSWSGGGGSFSGGGGGGGGSSGGGSSGFG